MIISVNQFRRSFRLKRWIEQVLCDDESIQVHRKWIWRIYKLPAIINQYVPFSNVLLQVASNLSSGHWPSVDRSATYFNFTWRKLDEWRSPSICRQYQLLSSSGTQVISLPNSEQRCIETGHTPRNNKYDHKTGIHHSVRCNCSERKKHEETHLKTFDYCVKVITSCVHRCIQH